MFKLDINITAYKISNSIKKTMNYAEMHLRWVFSTTFARQRAGRYTVVIRSRWAKWPFSGPHTWASLIWIVNAVGWIICQIVQINCTEITAKMCFFFRIRVVTLPSEKDGPKRSYVSNCLLLWLIHKRLM